MRVTHRTMEKYLVDEFKNLVSAYVSNDGEPDRIDVWSTEDLRKLFKFVQDELSQRYSGHSAGDERADRT